MVARWNEVVRPNDDVWHLGDFALKIRAAEAGALLRSLNGRKHLVTGNNDPPQTFGLARLSQLAVKHPSNGRISGGVVPQGRHHRMDGDYAIGMPSVVILGGGWSGKLILSR